MTHPTVQLETSRDLFRPYEYEDVKNENTGEMEARIKQRPDTLTHQEKKMVGLGNQAPDVAATLMAENAALKAQLLAQNKK